jgi:hypothetical protein
MGDDYPPEIEKLHAGLRRLTGVLDVASGIDQLDGLTGDDLSRADLAHLPHGALRRTAGCLPDESLIQVEFRLERSERGWRALEFLGWFVRDQARGGLAIQLRPFALPPVAGERVQLGESLRFHIDLFLPGAGSDLGPHLDTVNGIADDLRLVSELYDKMLRDRGCEGLLLYLMNK